MDDIALKNGEAVLMARIVDAAGVTIRPSWVEAIAYSICEFRARNKMAGDCPNFAGSAEQNGTVPLSEANLLHALGPCRGDNLAFVAGHRAIELDVNDVLFDSLQIGGPWTLDAAGYNFRHEIHIDQNGTFPNAGARYELRYEFTPTFGEKTIVRFQLGVIQP